MKLILCAFKLFGGLRVRSLFSWLETHVEHLLQGAAMEHAMAQPKDPFRPYENNDEYLHHCATMLALSEHTFRVQDNGEVKLRPSRLGFKQLMRLAVRESTTFSSADIDPTQVDGWRDFLACLELRHRLTHVRRGIDVHVSDENMSQLRKTISWWARIFRTIGEHRFSR